MIFKLFAILHQSTGQHQLGLAQVAERHPGSNPSFLAASREDGIPAGLAGSHPGHSDARKVKSQNSADGVRAFAIQDRLEQNPDLTLQRIAEAEGVSPSYVTRLLRLAYLAPDIVTAIVDGQQPPELTAEKLMRNTRLPLSWEAQRKRLGFKHA